jgi:glycosyltransferase involved in cell wall biosynthesis
LNAIDVFLAADIPNSVLEVKLSGLFSHRDCPPQRLDYTHTDGKQHEAITIDVGIWDTDTLVSWMHRGDAGLYLSAGEGFGLMPLQMMATGLPLVCAYNTGMMEYLTDETALCVPCTKAETTLYEHQSYNFEPDMAIAVDMLRSLAENATRRHDLGIRAAAHAATYTWDAAAHAAIHGLRNYYG